MNAAIASRDTGSFGQYEFATAHPVVTPRFLIHSTLGQNAACAGIWSSTSMKPTHGAAVAEGAACSRIAKARAGVNRSSRIVRLLARHSSGATDGVRLPVSNRTTQRACENPVAPEMRDSRTP